MAYSFEEVVSGAFSIEDWFKNLYMHASDKTGEALAILVREMTRKYKQGMNLNTRVKVKRLISKLENSIGAKRVDWDWVEDLDLDKWTKKEFSDVPPASAFEPAESVEFDINKLVDENNRRYTMEEFVDLYEAMNTAVQQADIQNKAKLTTQYGVKNSAETKRLHNQNLAYLKKMGVNIRPTDAKDPIKVQQLVDGLTKQNQ